MARIITVGPLCVKRVSRVSKENLGRLWCARDVPGPMQFWRRVWTVVTLLKTFEVWGAGFFSTLSGCVAKRVTSPYNTER